MQLDGLGDTSFSDILNNIVSEIPNIASGVATYQLASKEIQTRRAPVTYFSPSIPASYNPAYNPTYSNAPYPQARPVDNTLLYIALGIGGLLLFMGLRARSGK